MEGSCSCSLFCYLISLLLFLQLPTQGSTEEFLVKSPSQSIVAELGGNIMLPCSLYPAMNAENMELRWFRSQISNAVFVYRNKQEQKEEQMPQYAGRTSLVKDLLTSGEAAIRIDKVQVSDDGLYTCFFKKGGYSGEATMELKVAGMGSTPAVRIQGPEEDGVRVVCMTSAWFPKPQVQWRALNGEKFLVFSEVQSRDTEGLFHIETSLVVRDRIVGNVTCSIFNPILDQEKANNIFIPEPFFPQTSPWKIAFVVSISMLGLLILGTICFIIKEYTAKLKELKECKNLEQSKKEDRQLKDEALKARDELQAQLDWRKKVYQAAWRKAQLYADWRREQFQPWFVTLDPNSAPANLVISQNNTSLRRKDICENLYYDKCTVLGCEGISSGLYYWEVEVRNGARSEWAVGVCRENVDRRDWFKKNSENRFWAVRFFSDGCYACTNPKTWLTLRQVPCRVGVFLDYDKGDISFYNMTDGSHIFSFSENCFSEALFPYAMLQLGDISLTYCSMVNEPKEVLGFLNKSSVTELLSPPRKELCSSSCNDSFLLGVKSPLLHHCTAVSS